MRSKLIILSIAVFAGMGLVAVAHKTFACSSGSVAGSSCSSSPGNANTFHYDEVADYRFNNTNGCANGTACGPSMANIEIPPNAAIVGVNFVSSGLEMSNYGGDAEVYSSQISKGPNQSFQVSSSSNPADSCISVPVNSAGTCGTDYSDTTFTSADSVASSVGYYTTGAYGSPYYTGCVAVGYQYLDMPDASGTGATNPSTDNSNGATYYPVGPVYWRTDWSNNSTCQAYPFGYKGTSTSAYGSTSGLDIENGTVWGISNPNWGVTNGLGNGYWTQWSSNGNGAPNGRVPFVANGMSTNNCTTSASSTACNPDHSIITGIYLSFRDGGSSGSTHGSTVAGLNNRVYSVGQYNDSYVTDTIINSSGGNTFTAGQTVNASITFTNQGQYMDASVPYEQPVDTQTCPNPPQNSTTTSGNTTITITIISGTCDAFDYYQTSHDYMLTYNLGGTSFQVYCNPETCASSPAALHYHNLYPRPDYVLETWQENIEVQTTSTSCSGYPPKCTQQTTTNSYTAPGSEVLQGYEGVPGGANFTVPLTLVMPPSSGTYNVTFTMGYYDNNGNLIKAFGDTLTKTFVVQSIASISVAPSPDITSNATVSGAFQNQLPNWHIVNSAGTNICGNSNCQGWNPPVLTNFATPDTYTILTWTFYPSSWGVTTSLADPLNLMSYFIRTADASTSSPCGNAAYTSSGSSQGYYTLTCLNIGVGTNTQVSAPISYTPLCTVNVSAAVNVSGINQSVSNESYTISAPNRSNSATYSYPASGTNSYANFALCGSTNYATVSLSASIPSSINYNGQTFNVDQQSLQTQLVDTTKNFVIGTWNSSNVSITRLPTSGDTYTWKIMFQTAPSLNVQ